jgi:capsular exopolysaccharide synthesis family protein
VGPEADRRCKYRVFGLKGIAPVNKPLDVNNPSLDTGRAHRRRNEISLVGELDLRALILTLWRRKWLIVGCTSLILVVTALTLMQVTPQYSATVSIMMNTRENRVVDVESVLSGLPADTAAMLSEIEVIQSSQLIGRVVDKLRLDRDPEFNGALRPDGWRQSIKQLLATASSIVGSATVTDIDKTVDISLVSDPSERIRATVTKAIQGRLFVQPVQRSWVIDITFTSEDREKAALIANMIADQYLVDQLEAKYEATRRATSWLNDRLAELKTDIKASEAAVEEFKAQLGAGAGQGAELTVQQLTQLNAELILARTARAEAEARYNQVASLLNSEGISAATDVISSPLIQTLEQKLAELRREEAEFSTRYGDRHPDMINKRAEIADTEAAIASEVQKVISSLRTEVSVARTREQTLRAGVQELESRSFDQGIASVQLRQLEREAEANRLVYQSFLSRFKETQEQDDIQQADARIISRAEPPGGSSYPKSTLILAIAGAVGICLGIAIAFLLERLDNVFRSPRQIETTLAMSTLGMIPLLQRSHRRRDILNYVLKKPTSAFAESIRSLRTALLLSNVDNPPKVIALTSSVPEEGKSTTAVLLAETTAKMGKSVVLVDCDLRRPNLHQTLGLSNDRSLVQLLDRSAGFDDVLQIHASTGIHFIAAQSTAANAIDLLSSRAFSTLIRQLREHYELVILDTAPTLAVADSAVIGRQSDSVLFAIRWGRTPREAVEAGVRALRDAGVRLTGAVLTQVDLRRHAQYGYGDSGYYYGRYSGYYAN